MRENIQGPNIACRVLHIGAIGTLTVFTQLLYRLIDSQFKLQVCRIPSRRRRIVFLGTPSEVTDEFGAVASRRRRRRELHMFPLLSVSQSLSLSPWRALSHSNREED